MSDLQEELGQVIKPLDTADQLKLLKAVEQLLLEHEADLLLAAGRFKGIDKKARGYILQALRDVSREFRRPVRAMIEQWESSQRRQYLRRGEN